MTKDRTLILILFGALVTVGGVCVHQDTTITKQRVLIKKMYQDCPASPVEKSADKKLEEDLNREYAQNNKNFFDDRLPKDTLVVLKKNLIGKNGDKLLGSTLCIPNQTGMHCTIWLDPDMNPAEVTASLSLLHEQCHVRLWGNPGDPHGASFQACMLSLALHDAFRDIW
ncbi:MAG TPA: hypothetical protein VMH89_10545 [Candidatus Acidoferrum sp.]|nr:hypothetical protein [Candidatus Acidoferrum sp.]